MSSSKNKLRITTEGKIKLPISLALVVYSIVTSSITGILIVTAMLPSFGGDFFLMKNGNCFYNKTAWDFRLGVFFFMLSHVCYARLMVTEISQTILSIMGCVIGVYLIAIILGLKHKLVVSAIYVGVLVLSVVNTFYFNTMAFVGGMLFLVSDFAIGIFDIIHKKNLLREIVVWGTYVPAQILMMSSFFFI